MPQVLHGNKHPSSMNTLWNPDPQTVYKTIYDSSVDVKENLAIEGKLLTSSYTMNMDEFIRHSDLDTWKDNIREKLVYDLVRKMIELDLVEITKQDNPVDWTTNIRARCFLTTKESILNIRKASK